MKKNYKDYQINEILETFNNILNLTEASQTLKAPLDGELTVTSPFGAKRSYETHPGVDLRARERVNVLSPLDGKVTIADMNSNPKCGGTIDIQHADGLKSRFCHISKMNVKTGDIVKQGQVVGLSGGDANDPGHGNSKQRHLHWTLLKNGSKVNPMEYLGKSVSISSNFATTTNVGDIDDTEQSSTTGKTGSSLTNSLLSNLTSPGTSNSSDPVLMNILKSVGGIAGLVSMTEIEEIDDVYNSINETKKEVNKLILKENKVFSSFGNDVGYSYGDANIPKNKNTSIKSPVDGTVESISYNRSCTTDIIKIKHEINNKPHYLTFCGVNPIKVSAGQSVSKGTKLGEPKDDVKVTLEDSVGNKLPIKSYLNMKNTNTDINTNKEKEVNSGEKRYSDPLLMSIVTAPLRLLKGKKDSEGRYEKRWASPTDPAQPNNWISKWSPSKKNPK